MTIDDRLRAAAQATRDSVQDLPAIDRLHQIVGRQRRRMLLRAVGQLSIVLIVFATGLVAGLVSDDGPSTTVPPSPRMLPTVHASCAAPPSIDAGANPVNYKATNVIDGDATTAWRCEGNGVGMTLTLSWPTPVHITRLGLIPGYAKVDLSSRVDRFPQHRRVKSVTYQFDGTPGTVQQSFEDLPTLQTINVNAVTTKIQIRIDSTTPPGDPDHDYTAISEVLAA